VRAWLKLNSRQELFFVLFALILGALPRLYLLIETGFGIEADEAIVGLMAKHMVEGVLPWPTFYYGQPYMGSFEPTLVSLVYRVFGVSSWGLKLVPLFFSFLHILLVWALVRRFCEPIASFLAILSLSIAPSALILWSSKARGGFIELVVIGTLALIIAIDILRSSKPKPVSTLLLGLVVGLGWWVNYQIAYYAVPIALCLALTFLRPTGFAGFTRTVFIGLFGFLLGGAPFWLANIFGQPAFESFTWMAKADGSVDVVKHLGGFFSGALPIIFGARRFWSEVDLFQNASCVAFWLYGVAFLVGVLKYLTAKGDKAIARRFDPGLLLILLFVVSVCAIFSFSSFGWLNKAPRYLLPLYSVLPVFVGLLVTGTSKLSRATGSLCVIGILSLHIASNILSGGAIAGQPFVYRGQRVAEDHSELYRWLREHNYKHIKTDYWIGYRVAFETREEVTFSRFKGPKENRIPAYTLMSEPGIEHSVYILVPRQSVLVEKGLRGLGYDFVSEQVGDYVAIHHVRSRIDLQKAKDIKPSSIEASSRQDWVVNLVDDEPGSRWGSGSPQAPGMEIIAYFKQKPALRSIVVDYGFWPQDYPRGLSIELKGLDGKWCRILDTRDNPGVEYLIKDQRQIKVVFPEQAVVGVRFSQLGSHPILDWSVAELSFLGS
jgi:hypothetical protein